MPKELKPYAFRASLPDIAHTLNFAYIRPEIEDEDIREYFNSIIRTLALIALGVGQTIEVMDRPAFSNALAAAAKVATEHAPTE